jgi:beta-galactosidase
LVVAPDLNVIPRDLADHLLTYVRDGGHLVLGPRSGMKDEHNGLLPQRQPGYLTDALGGRVEQYYALEKDVNVQGDWGSGQATVWAEQLGALHPDSKILLRYGKANGWLDDQPAVLTSTYGKGTITYVGAILDDRLMKAAADWMVKQSGVVPAFSPVPEGVEVAVRSGTGKQVVVLVNFSTEARKVELGKKMKLLLSERQAESVDLKPYDVAIVVVY